MLHPSGGGRLARWHLGSAVRGERQRQPAFAGAALRTEQVMMILSYHLMRLPESAARVTLCKAPCRNSYLALPNIDIGRPETCPQRLASARGCDL